MSRFILVTNRDVARDRLRQVRELYETDPLNAVITAYRWADIDIDFHDAMWEFVRDQTVLPKCKYCQWPILPDEPHLNCFDGDSDTNSDAEARCGGDRPGLMTDDVPDDFIEYDEVDIDDDDVCPHCGSYTCDTWDCQQ